MAKNAGMTSDTALVGWGLNPLLKLRGQARAYANVRAQHVPLDGDQSSMTCSKRFSIG